jgi:hypothetical protein
MELNIAVSQFLKWGFLPLLKKIPLIEALVLNPELADS